MQRDREIESLLAGLFPSGVRVAAARMAADLPVPELRPEEEPHVARAVPKRRREYAVGRWLAREALAQLGHGTVAIPAGPDRGPRWPAGVVGSISHCRGLAVAVVAPSARLRAVGVDIEPIDAVEPDVAEYVTTPDERARFTELPDAVDWVKLVFGAKETVHKCVAPLTGVTLGFQDVEVLLDPRGRGFTVRYVGGDRPGLPPLESIVGRFHVTPTHVLIGAVLVADAAEGA